MCVCACVVGGGVFRCSGVVALRLQHELEDELPLGVCIGNKRDASYRATTNFLLIYQLGLFCLLAALFFLVSAGKRSPKIQPSAYSCVSVTTSASTASLSIFIAVCGVSGLSLCVVCLVSHCLWCL